VRIDRLTIREFKNLREFGVDFDEKSPTTVLIGRNGTGKSNLIEALVLIFRNLDLNEPPPFAYFIRYVCRGKVIEIEADPSRRSRRTVAKIDGKPIPYSRLVGGRGRPHLPSHVFGYYSGPSRRLERHFDRHQERFKKELIQPATKETILPLRPLFNARHEHSQFVLLSFFVDQDAQVREFLRGYLNITDLDSVRFVLKKPPWARPKASADTFWGARGVVRVFLDRLRDLATAPLRTADASGDDRIHLFLKDIHALEALYAKYGSQADFFKTLESTDISELIENLQIRVRIRGMDEALTFVELAEGEQQLLTVLGLLRFTREEESLFLLDEPDTHLNPSWSLGYLDLLNEVIGDTTSSHIIMATHDPLTIGGLLKSQVQVLYRDAATGQIRAEQPQEDPKGMGVAALLTSEPFGLRSTVDLDTLQDLDRKRELASREQRTDAENEELGRLNESLGNIDYSLSVRDPLYKRFVEAMVTAEEYQRLKKPTLTREELEQQRELALRIVEKLKREDGE